jgi:Mg-chelatase subunit ChlD
MRKESSMKRHALALVAAILLGSALPDTIIAQSSRLPPAERPRMIPKEERLPSDQSGSPRQDPSRQGQTGQDPSRQDPAQGAGDDDSTIKIDTTLVTIPVTVLDRDGKYIPNLTKRNFQLWEDDIQQEISDFTSVEVPFNVVLLLDTSRSTVFRLEDIQRAAVAFVEQLRPEDRVMVVSFDDKVYVDSEFTSDRARLRRAIYQTRTGGGTKLYDAVDLVISERLNRVDGRKAIVLFTDGVDTTSRLANAASTLEQVEESDVLVYPIRYDTEGQLNRPPIYGPNGPTINIPWPLPRLPRGRRWPVVPQWPRGGAPGG